MVLGAMGVGVFTKDYAIVHGAVSSAAFFFGGLSAVTSAFALKRPFLDKCNVRSNHVKRISSFLPRYYYERVDDEHYCIE
jgi:hypothetical membrane protein